MDNNQKNFFIKSGYRSRILPEYFQDIMSDKEDVIHQPEIYPFAAYLGKCFDCTHIIDIGCGNGKKLVRLYPEFQIIGIDFGENLKQCCQRYKFGTWIEWNLDKPDRIAISENILKRSVIICSDVIEHLVSPVYLLDSLKHLLYHSPICLLSTPERDLVRGKDDQGPPANPSHVREWNMTELEQLLIDKRLNLKFIGLTENNNRDHEKKTTIAIIERDENNSICKKILRPIFNPISNFRVVAVMTVYNEEDIIIPSIKRLIDQGIEVYVIDNWSTDKTYDLVKYCQFPELVGYERFPKEGPSPYYNWKDLLGRVEELAASIKADWFIHHDVDEVRTSPWRGVSLKEAIYMTDTAGFNSIDHTVIDFHPIDNGFVPGSDFGMYFRYFEFGKRPGHFLQVKAWKNFGQQISLAESGGHEIRFDGRRIYPYKFILKHYPIRSQSHGEKKIFSDRKERWNPGEKAVGWHTRYDDIKEGQTFLHSCQELELFDDDRFNMTYIVEMLSGIGILSKNMEYK